MALGTLTKVTVTAGVAVRFTETSTKVSTFCIQPLAGDGAYVGANTGKTFIGIKYGRRYRYYWNPAWMAGCWTDYLQPSPYRLVATTIYSIYVISILQHP